MKTVTSEGETAGLSVEFRTHARSFDSFACRYDWDAEHFCCRFVGVCQSRIHFCFGKVIIDKCAVCRVVFIRPGLVYDDPSFRANRSDMICQGYDIREIRIRNTAEMAGLLQGYDIPVSVSQCR